MSSPSNPSSGGTATEQGFSPSQTLNQQEEKLRRLYGRLPQKSMLDHRLKERKYFDSGDYALSKAGKTTAPVGSQHPQPENIPHSTPQTATQHHLGSPPVKESSLIHETEPTRNYTTMARANV
ncbi:hypothetical protein BGZ98_003525 [Dissophora globulifera]|nr:hypothetical protein BGZ98_003525 [Dissophora globulifera]